MMLTALLLIQLTGLPDASCGWLPKRPAEPQGNSAFYHHRLGCRVSKAPFSSATVLSPVSVELLKDKTVVRLVFVNNRDERVLADGRRVRFDMRLAKRKRGSIKLKASMRRDGVYTIELPPNAMGRPCENFLSVRYRKLQMEIDDWRYGC